MHVIAARLTAAFVSAGLVLAAASAASAASPLAGIPVGKSVTYHITSQTAKPPAEGGQSSTNNYVRIVRNSPGAFAVQVDGAPAGEITANPDGSFNIPPGVKKVLAPFGEIAILTRSAPQPLAPNSAWAATVPVPIGDDTDNLTTTVAVSSFTSNGATIVASGQNNTSVQPLIRSKPADVNYNATMTYDQNHVLVGANRNISITIKDGAFRTKHITTSWTSRWPAVKLRSEAPA